MLFNSFAYLQFLLVIWALYWLIPKNFFRKVLLLIGSYYFYMSWFAPYGYLLAEVTLISYMGVLLMQQFQPYKKIICGTSVAVTLSFLLYYKYWALLTKTAFYWWPQLFETAPNPSILLPLAISFFTFQAISYIVDVYRGKQETVTNLIDYALYISFFPQLIAGPIVRSTQFLFQLERLKKFHWAEMGWGLKTFIIGLLFKMIADDVSPFVDEFFSEPNHHFARSWTAIYGFTLQIFCDFAGYTAMARGSSMLFGFHIPRNFKHPYFSPTITIFWRRWHMSLSSWLKEYLYIPLGGNRKGRVRTYINLLATMGLGGLWHGANWTFLIWGIYHGLLLSLDKFANHFKLFNAVKTKSWFIVLSTIITFHLVCIGWIIFRAESFDNLAYIMTHAIWPSNYFKLTYDAKHILLTVVIFLGLSLGYLQGIRYGAFRRWLHHPATVVVLYTAIFFVIFSLYRTTSQFIYFQF